MKGSLFLLAGACLFLSPAAKAATGADTLTGEMKELDARIRRGFEIQWLAFSLDNSELIIGLTFETLIWPLKERTFRLAPLSWAERMRLPPAFSADGGRMLTDDSFGGVIRDSRTWAPLKKLQQTKTAGPQTMHLSADGSKVSVRFGMTTNYLWEAGEEKPFRELQTGTDLFPKGEGFSADGSRFMTIMSQWGGKTEIWTWRNRWSGPAREVLDKDSCRSAYFSPDGIKALLFWQDKDPEILDFTNMPLPSRRSFPGMNTNAWRGAFSADGARVLLSGSGGAWLFDVRTGKPLFLRRRDGTVNEAPFDALSRDGRHVAMIGRGNEPVLRIWSEDGSGRWTLEAELDPFRAAGAALAAETARVLGEKARLVDPKRSEIMTAEERFRIP